jgi:hypothetical protein
MDEDGAWYAPLNHSGISTHKQLPWKPRASVDLAWALDQNDRDVPAGAVDAWNSLDPTTPRCVGKEGMI